MTPEQSTELRKPFPKEVVGKLPRGNAQLDYVGHAAVTDRLLSVDEEWTWEPLAYTETGLPAYDNAGGLWIKLTVGGVTRLGYGDGPDPKQRIGDALRNAAMRFGVALTLWTKDELESTVDVHAHNAAQEAAYTPPDTEQDKNAMLAHWRDYLLAGPEEKTTKGWNQFVAKAHAAAVKQHLAGESVEGLNGEPCTLKELIEQIQLRQEAA